jgi:predicted RNA binding protein YcfA (HicA-like mRNA interferase family)
MKLPVVSGTDAIRALRKVGYEIDEQHGSHIILRSINPPHRLLSVPSSKTGIELLSVVAMPADLP